MSNTAFCKHFRRHPSTQGRGSLQETWARQAGHRPSTETPTGAHSTGEKSHESDVTPSAPPSRTRAPSPHVTAEQDALLRRFTPTPGEVRAAFTRQPPARRAPNPLSPHTAAGRKTNSRPNATAQHNSAARLPTRPTPFAGGAPSELSSPTTPFTRGANVRPDAARCRRLRRAFDHASVPPQVPVPTAGRKTPLLAVATSASGAYRASPTCPGQRTPPIRTNASPELRARAAAASAAALSASSLSRS